MKIKYFLLLVLLSGTAYMSSMSSGEEEKKGEGESAKCFGPPGLEDGPEGYR